MVDRGALERQAHVLPRPRTSFVGRESELARLGRLLDQSAGRAPALVTLTGAPGSGKTRLAIEAAARLVANATFTSIGFVDASTFGPAETEQVLELVRSALAPLRGQRNLLIVDNFEQVVGAAADLATVVAAHPDTSTLVTSQRPLGVYGERQLAVAPLQSPPAATSGLAAEVSGYSAVQLFVDRACARAHDFELTDRNAPAIAEICRRLDGLPLAIELAAARVKLLPPEALLRRLDDRLSLLTGGPRDLPDRHRTLRAAIDWTYQLLNPDQQHLLQALVVFHGGFDMDAAAAVLGTRADLVLDTLQALIESGLVYLESAADEPRYHVLETVREYAAEMLAESGNSGAVRERYADYFVHPGAHLSPNQTRLAPADDENLHHALASVLSETLERGRRAGDRHQQAMALAGLGRLEAAAGELDLARAYFEDSVRLFAALGDEAAVSIARLDLAEVVAIGDPNRGLELLKQALRLASEAHHTTIVRSALEGLAGLAAEHSRPETAARLLGAASALSARAAARPSVLLNRLATTQQAARTTVGDDRYSAAFAEGQAAPLGLAIDQALALELADAPVEDPKPRVNVHADELSPREREVAVLIARGQTNRAIAHALVITEWTVDSHVRHILAKLNLRSRSQVAAWAVERGLITSSL